VSRTVTLSQLRDDVSTQADIVGAVGASKRHTPTMMNRYINQAIQRFREKLSSQGAPRYLVSTTGSLTAGLTSPYAFSLLDLSSADPGVVRVHGLDITVNNSITKLIPVPFSQRSEYGTATGIPCCYAQYDTDKLAILPAPESAYTYVCWYLPVLDDLANDADTWDGVAGWEQWITWDVVVRHLVRDQTSRAYAMAMGYRNEIMADIIASASETNVEAPRALARDDFGARLYTGRNFLHRRLPPRY
jgi:hypothetical protein